MKLSAGTIGFHIAAFIWSIFMGVTAVSIGLGADYPPLNLIAKPIVCPNGQMTFNGSTSNPLPGTTITQYGWYCVDSRTETSAPIDIFSIALAAGPIYGLLIEVLILIAVFLYSRWNPSTASPEARKRMGWIQGGIVGVIIVGITLFNLYPLFRSLTPVSTSAPDSTATSVALTFQALTAGTPSAFSSTDKPLSSWNDIPIMPQATAGQQVNPTTYAFRVPVDSGTVESFYSSTLKSQGWNLQDSRWLGMKFTKDKNTVLVTLAPAVDLQSWIVTLVLVP